MTEYEKNTLSLLPSNIIPVQELIDGLKTLLREVEKGEIRSMIMISQYNNNDMVRMIIMEKKVNIYAMIGGLQVAICDIINNEWFRSS